MTSSSDMAGRFSREQFEHVRDNALEAAREAVGSGPQGLGSVFGREAAEVEIDRQCRQLGLTEDDFRQAEREAEAKGWGHPEREIARNTAKDYEDPEPELGLGF